MATRRSTTTFHLAVLLAAAPLLLGCAAGADPAPRSAETLEGTRDTDQPSRSAARAPLRTRLLDAAALPRVDGKTWVAVRTAQQEPQSLAGTCHRFSMLSIGAVHAAHRGFASRDGDARADHLVATFADAKTAWRAYEVLRSWHAGCAGALRDYDRRDVGPLREVDTARGQAHRYVLGYGPSPDRPRVGVRDAEGLALVGRRVTVLRMTWPEGRGPQREPMAAVLRAAVSRLV
jgi:hypothetical protein